jgi:hypothetical protein
MCNSIQEPTIELAFQKFNTPVGPVYFVRRWGREKKCFSRDTALRYLAYFMTDKAFRASGFKQRYPDMKVINPVNPEVVTWKRGELTDEYRDAHDRCIRRLRLILARVRQRREWQTKWDSFVERTEKEREALKACKPF